MRMTTSYLVSCIKMFSGGSGRAGGAGGGGGGGRGGAERVLGLKIDWNKVNGMSTVMIVGWKSGLKHTQRMISLKDFILIYIGHA